MRLHLSKTFLKELRTRKLLPKLFTFSKFLVNLLHCRGYTVTEIVYFHYIPNDFFVFQRLRYA